MVNKYKSEYINIIGWIILISSIIIQRKYVEYTAYISFIDLVIFSVLLYIVHRTYKDSPEFDTGKTVIPKGNIRDRCVDAYTDLFQNYVSPTSVRDTIFRIRFKVSEELRSEGSDTNKEKLTLIIVRKCSHNGDKDCNQKVEGINIKKECAVDIGVDPIENINFRFDKNVKIKSFSVDEFYTM